MVPLGGVWVGGEILPDAVGCEDRCGPGEAREGVAHLVAHLKDGVVAPLVALCPGRVPERGLCHLGDPAWEADRQARAERGQRGGRASGSAPSRGVHRLLPQSKRRERGTGSRCHHEQDSTYDDQIRGHRHRRVVGGAWFDQPATRAMRWRAPSHQPPWGPAGQAEQTLLIAQFRRAAVGLVARCRM